MSEINGCPNPDCHDPNCEGAHNHLPPMIQHLLGLRQKPTKQKDLGLLSAGEVTLFNEMRNAFIAAKRQAEHAEELKKKFWAVVRLNHNLFSDDYDNLHVDKTTGMLSHDVVEKTDE